MSFEDWEKSFARNFFLLRRENGLTQKQMAEKLNISVYAVQKIEQGTVPKRFGANVLIDIYHIFGVLPEKMFH